MTDTEQEDDLKQDMAEEMSLSRELSFLFGKDVVEQARLLDVADLNMTDEMTAAIGEGVRHLKQLKSDPDAQREWVKKQTPGLCLLLCLWIMDMHLLDKIQIRSYINS